MTISSAIHAARSGLQATSLQADIVANNVANANTPGYVRRSVLLGENVLGGKSSGVLSEGIARDRNEAVTAQRRASATEVAHASILASQRATLSQAFGDTASDNGLVSRLSNLENTLKQAAQTPESATVLQGVFSAAKSVTSEFERLSTLADDLFRTTDSSIVSTVGAINETLKSIETLNGKIAGIDRTSSGAAGLMDERDRALDQLSGFLAIDIIPREGGQLDVITSEGVYLLQGRANQIAISSENTATGPQVIGVSVGDIDITPGAQTFSAVSTGQLGALFTFRDNELPAFSAKLDALAGDLEGRFTGDSVDPGLPPGAPGLFVFTAEPGSPHLPGRLSLNAQVDPEQGGEIFRLRSGMTAALPGPDGQSDILQAMADALGETRSIDQDGIRGRFDGIEMAAHTASLLGQARISQSTALAASQAQLQALTEVEQSQSGVNIDDQMQQLLLIEQSYAANARIIQAADDMLQRLIEL